MKKIIRLTESDLHRIVKQSVMRILKEDGALGGTSSFSVNSPAGGGLGSTDPTGQGHNNIDVPINAKPLKQKHNLGKMDDFYKDSLKRNDDEENHSISMHRVGEKK